jgi:hypothetical protein
MKTTNSNRFDLAVILINILLMTTVIISPIFFKNHFHIKPYYFIIPFFAVFFWGRKNLRVGNLLLGLSLIVIFLVSYLF